MVNEDKRRAHMLETQTKKKRSHSSSASRHEPKLMTTAQMLEEVEREVMLQVRPQEERSRTVSSPQLLNQMIYFITESGVTAQSFN